LLKIDKKRKKFVKKSLSAEEDQDALARPSCSSPALRLQWWVEQTRLVGDAVELGLGLGPRGGLATLEVGASRIAGGPDMETALGSASAGDE